MKSKMVLSEDIPIICPWCSNKSSAGEWDENTYKQCTCRKMRRLYLNIRDTRAFYRESNKYYKCPKCGMWSKGSQLKIDSDDPKLRKLGGEPLNIKVVNTDSC